MTHTINIPRYVAIDFNRALSKSGDKTDEVPINMRRIFLLLADTLRDIHMPDWEINYGEFRSKNDIEPYGFEFLDDKIFIYSKERGSRSTIAIFKNAHLASEYFVWLVSSGKKTINWDSLP